MVWFCKSLKLVFLAGDQTRPLLVNMAEQRDVSLCQSPLRDFSFNALGENKKQHQFISVPWLSSTYILTVSPIEIQLILYVYMLKHNLIHKELDKGRQDGDQHKMEMKIIIRLKTASEK